MTPTTLGQKFISDMLSRKRDLYDQQKKNGGRFVMRHFREKSDFCQNGSPYNGHKIHESNCIKNLKYFDIPKLIKDYL